jgi:membrane AbrB-like protein
MKYIHLLLLIGLSFLISFTLFHAGLILPWLFGSMAATFIYIRFVSGDFYFPVWLGNLGVFVIGLEIGTQFTPDVFGDMAGHALNIVLLTICVILLSLLLAKFFMKMTGCTPETAVLSSIPGALSQMVLMAEEDKRADILLVTITQISRIVLVVIIVPFIANFFQNGESTGGEMTAPLLTEVMTPVFVWILIGAVVLMMLLKLLKFPVPFMLGPILAVVIWNLITADTFSLNVEFMFAAQILFGIRMGRQLSSLVHQLNGRMVVAMLIQNTLLIVGTLLLVVIFQLFTDSQFNDLFLSAAPGGIGQLIVVAVEMGADIATISSYHIFRIFFIILIVTPLIDYFLKKKRRIE